MQGYVHAQQRALIEKTREGTMIKPIEFEEIRMDKLIDGDRVSDGIYSLVKKHARVSSFAVDECPGCIDEDLMISIVVSKSDSVVVYSVCAGPGHEHDAAPLRHDAASVPRAAPCQ